MRVNKVLLGLITSTILFACQNQESQDALNELSSITDSEVIIETSVTELPDEEGTIVDIDSKVSRCTSKGVRVRFKNYSQTKNKFVYYKGENGSMYFKAVPKLGGSFFLGTYNSRTGTIRKTDKNKFRYKRKSTSANSLTRSRMDKESWRYKTTSCSGGRYNIKV